MPTACSADLGSGSQEIPAGETKRLRQGCWQEALARLLTLGYFDLAARFAVVGFLLPRIGALADLALAFTGLLTDFFIIDLLMNWVE